MFFPGKIKELSAQVELLTKKVQEHHVTLLGIEARSFGYRDSDTIERLKKENIELRKRIAAMEEI